MGPSEMFCQLFPIKIHAEKVWTVSSKKHKEEFIH